MGIVKPGYLAPKKASTSIPSQAKKGVVKPSSIAGAKKVATKISAPPLLKKSPITDILGAFVGGIPIVGQGAASIGSSIAPPSSRAEAMGIHVIRKHPRMNANNPKALRKAMRRIGKHHAQMVKLDKLLGKYVKPRSRRAIRSHSDMGGFHHGK